MLKNKGLIAVLLVATLLFTSLFSTMIIFADEEEQVEDNTYVNPDTGESDLNGYKGLVAHWKFDSDLKDSSQFKNDGEAVGGKTGITFVDAVSGKGVRLDGKSYIKVKNSDSLDLTDEFTFSFWVYKEDMRKKDNMEGGVPYIIKYNEEGYDFPYGVYEWDEMTPGVTFCDENGADDIHSEKQIDIQKWTLVSATYDGDTMKIYIDKELVKSQLISSSLVKSSQPLYIGFGHFMTVDNYFKGILDDMKIYNKALTYSEIENLYDNMATKAPGKDFISKPNNMIAYYNFENNLKDLSGFKNDGVAVKASNFNYIDGVAGKGIKFNGASYIQVKDSDSLDLDKGFTFAVWVYKEKTKNSQPIFAKYGSSINKKECSYNLLDWGSSTGPRLSLSNFDNGGEFSEFEADIESDAYNDGKWYHYTATYDGKNDSDETEDEINGDNTVKIYLNGNLVKSEEFSGDISNSSGPLWIGGTTDSVYFKGIMDEFRIYNYALTPTQVKTLSTMRDGIEVVTNNKNVVLSSLKQKQSIQLTTNLLTHMFTPPGSNLQNGKEELKKLDVSAKAKYNSSNAKVATVSNTGKITTVGKGKATITVTYGKLSKSIAIVVK